MAVSRPKWKDDEILPFLILPSIKNVIPKVKKHHRITKEEANPLQPIPILRQPDPYCVVGMNRICRVEHGLPASRVQDLWVVPKTPEGIVLKGFLDSFTVTGKEIKVTFFGMHTLEDRCKHFQIHFEGNLLLELSHPKYATVRTNVFSIGSKYPRQIIEDRKAKKQKKE